jgi:vitamin B12/bleomycin/antimicrobial peptide transport system ATP-binding/permease protein
MNNDRADDTANPKAEAEEIANARLMPQLKIMASALWAAQVRNVLFMFWGALFLVIAATAYGQIKLNAWNQPFYDALSHRNFAQFLDQLEIGRASCRERV